MGIINLTEREKAALKSLDERAIDKLIDRAVQCEDLGQLHQLRLSECGPFVSGKLHYFEQAIRECTIAKSDRKREDAYDRARRAGGELSSAIYGMKARMEEDEREGELFRVDDHLHPPYRFTDTMQVRVAYQWRRAATDPWNYGALTVNHKVRPSPNFYPTTTKRKPSRAKAEQDRQDDLARTWEHPERIALYSLRDYFRQGGDGEKIPESFTAKVDHLGGLNNFSADFWRDRL